MQGVLHLGICMQGVLHSGGLHSGGSASKGALYRGECLHSGVCIQGSLYPGGYWAYPPPFIRSKEYDQRAGGTHPTGMHSCNVNYVHVDDWTDKRMIIASNVAEQNTVRKLSISVLYG